VKLKLETEFQDTEIGKIPREWKIKRLGHIVKYVKGKKPSVLFDERLSEEFVPYLTADYMRGLDKPKWCNPKLESNIIRVSRDDVIMIWDGSSGDVFTGFDGILASTMIRIMPSIEVNKKFLYYYLMVNFEKFRSTTVGTVIPHVNKKVFEEFPIPVPPLHEQVRIAEILSTVDRAIEVVDAGVVRLEGLKKALMRELLTGRIRVREENGKLVFNKETEFRDTEIGKIPREWKIYNIEEIFDLYKGTTPSSKEDKYWGGDIPFVTPTDITALNEMNKIYLSTTEKYLTEEGRRSKSLRLIPRGSLLFTSRATIGYLAVNNVEVAINQGIIALIPKIKDLDVSYYYYHLTSIRKKLEELAGGSTYKEISMNTFRKFMIPYPPLEEQRKIAGILSTVDRAIELYREERVRLERLKRGLMDLLLTGRVRVVREG